ncbi:hypothetical protein K0M31_014050 [Melipona bicolor]|uniref:Uncharacterized protein n=1 Tax=Melipona bicolor TaxID=60889 RepID=A0AA40G8G6_9HYME|nr:hypothetical protein K0M31_014050 [Melipona bicolor]
MAVETNKRITVTRIAEFFEGDSNLLAWHSIPSLAATRFATGTAGRAGWPLSDDKGAREKTNCLQRTKGGEEQQEDEDEEEEEEEENGEE